MRTAVATTAKAASTSAFLGSRGGRVRIEPKIARILDGIREARGRSDHRRVVRAEWQWREGRGRGKRSAQLRVRSHATDHGDLRRTELRRSLLGPPDESAHDRRLIARGEIGTPPFELIRRQVLDGVQQCSLEPREREVEPGHPRDGKVVRAGVSPARNTVDLGAAGVAEPEEARSLVESLPRGVVERRAEHPGLADTVLNVQQHRVTTAREEAEERWLDGVRLEIERRDVSLEVIHG